MAKKRSMRRNKIHDKKRIKTWYNGGAAPWSDLNHHLLYIIMMQLGVVDFIAFSGVCKSWRSIALSNRTMFMASRPPMLTCISTRVYKNGCYLIDFEGRKFRTILPHLVGRTCVGSTCGYLILFGWETRDFWLVNPIKRHELHFPNVPFYRAPDAKALRSILVFSPYISEWLFVIVNRYDCRIWFSIAGKGKWNYVFSNSPIRDLHAFKGKIYTLNYSYENRYLYELRLNPKPKLMLLKTKFSKSHFFEDIVRSGENLYLVEQDSEGSYEVHKLDVDETKWILLEKKREEYAFFLSDMNHGAAGKQESWADPCLPYGRYADYKKIGKGRLFTANMWYFPHDCLNVNLID